MQVRQIDKPQTAEPVRQYFKIGNMFNTLANPIWSEVSPAFGRTLDRKRVEDCEATDIWNTIAHINNHVKSALAVMMNLVGDHGKTEVDNLIDSMMQVTL